MLICEQENTISNLKRIGVFKLFGGNSHHHFTRKIIKELLKHGNELSLRKSTLAYLKSKKELSNLLSNYNHIKKNLVDSLKKQKYCVITDLLFLSDYLFYDLDFSPLDDRIFPDYNISPEKFIDAVSYILFIYSKNIGLLNKYNLCIDKNEVLSNENYKKLILNANKIREIEEAEILVDYYNYKCTYIQNSLVLDGNDTRLEKSMAHGFIYADTAKSNILHPELTEVYGNSESLSNVVTELYKYSDGIIKLVEKPIKRYVMSISKNDEFVSILKQESLYYEEIAQFIINTNENFMEYSDLVKFSISKNLTLWDLVIIKRVFIILSGTFYKKIKEIEKYDPNLALRSWLPSFTRKMLLDFIRMFLSKYKAEEFIEIFTWDNKKKGVLDLQYTPIIKVGPMYYLCNNIFINSNTLRNTIMKEKIKRPIEKSGKDVTSNIIFNALKGKFQNVSLEIGFNYSGFHGDFDVLMYCENTLYIFECKNIISPVGLHELRSTLDNVKYGFKQLDKAREAFNNKEFISYINKKLKWSLEKGSFNIVTCLVLSNRMFSGYSYKKNHVRSVYELQNFISTGVIKTEEMEYSLWSSTDITNMDLYLYLEKDIFHSIIFNSMISRYKKIVLKDKNIAIREYGVDITTSIKKINSKFKNV